MTKKRGWLPSNYVAQTKSVENQPWFHGKISRTAAEHLLTRYTILYGYVVIILVVGVAVALMDHS